MSQVRLSLARLDPADLPPVCVICGQTADGYVRKTFTWRPAWLSAASIISIFFACMILFTWPILFVLSLIKRRQATVSLPMCRRHQNYWVRRYFWTLTPLLVLVFSSLSIGILVVMRLIPLAPVFPMVLGMAVIFLAWALAALLAQRWGLHAKEITSSDLFLAGVHPAFAELVRAGRSHWMSGSDAADGWEDYDPYPRQPPAKAK
jgi:tellurite resistance protein TehA-like permease